MGDGGSKNWYSERIGLNVCEEISLFRRRSNGKENFYEGEGDRSTQTFHYVHKTIEATYPKSVRAKSKRRYRFPRSSLLVSSVGN
jgi:hypothetical protein